jgi:protein-disulfide isomerase
MDESATLTPAVSEDDHAEGSANAPVTLVEYGDYQCPACGAAYPLVKELQKAFPKELRFVFRNFPLTQLHPYALAAAETAEAAALQGKFWEMHDLLFERQESLEPGILAGWAREVGLDLEEFRSALQEGEIEKRIKKDRSGGIRSGVNGTPTFFINGVRYDGARDYGSMRDVFKQMIAEAK